MVEGGRALMAFLLGGTAVGKEASDAASGLKRLAHNDSVYVIHFHV